MECVYYVCEGVGMTGHWATDMVIHLPSVQQRRGQTGAAIWGTGGFSAPIGMDGKWVLFFLVSPLFLSSSLSIQKKVEKRGTARRSAPGQCSPPMCPALSLFLSLSTAPCSLVFHSLLCGRLFNSLSPCPSGWLHHFFLHFS